MPVCHRDHHLHSSFSLKCKNSVLYLFLIILRIRISHLSDQISVYIQIIRRKYFNKTYCISFFLLRKHQCQPICSASKRRFILISKIHATIFSYGNITAVVLFFMFLKLSGCQQQIRIIFPFSCQIMYRILLYIKNPLYCTVTFCRIFVVKAVKQKEHTHGQGKHSCYKYQ